MTSIQIIIGSLTFKRIIHITLLPTYYIDYCQGRLQEGP